MLIVFEGHDLSGKTTLANRVARELNNCFYLKNYHIPISSTKNQQDKVKRSYERILDFYKEVSYETGHSSHVIVDRFYMSELVYSKVIRGYDAIEDKFYSKFNSLMKHQDAILILVETSEVVLEERYQLRGDKLLTLEQILEVRSGYRTCSNIVNFRNKLILNNDTNETEQNVSTILNLIR